MNLYIYIYILYAPNLRSRIALFDREGEHGRFEGSTKRATREQGRARGTCLSRYLLPDGAQ